MKLDDKLFWEAISELNWCSDYDYNRIDFELTSETHGDYNFMIKLLNTYNEKIKILNTIVDNMSDSKYSKYIDKSDDGLSDLLAHIVGSGEKAFNKVVKNVKKFRCFTDEARESFGYSFHGLYDLMDKKKKENNSISVNDIQTLQTIQVPIEENILSKITDSNLDACAFSNDGNTVYLDLEHYNDMIEEQHNDIIDIFINDLKEAKELENVASICFYYSN